MRLVSAPDVTEPALRPFIRPGKAAGSGRRKSIPLSALKRSAPSTASWVPRPGILPADIAATLPMLRLSRAGRSLRRSRRWTGGD